MARGLAWSALWLTSSTSLVSTAAATNVSATAPIVDLDYAQYQAHFDTWTNITTASTSLAGAVAVNATAPIVDLGYAQYQGQFDAEAEITSFLGIRYAAPPVGKLRLQAPQSPVFQSGVQPATQNPVSCYETRWGESMTPLVQPHGNNKQQSTTIDYSEDCLFLNVFVPGTLSARGPVTTGGLPVLVWIHGGGYHFGNAAAYNGADLVVDSLNTVVVVVIQYRLGAFGFLSGNEVKVHGALNAGLLDQNFALQWVQDHIGSFGGDKAHVTIWGESAGGGSALQHIVAHGGNTQPPLFDAAITSSMYLPSQYDYNHRVPQLLYDRVAAMTGCASSVDRFTCLQSVEVDKLQEANRGISLSGFYGTFVFAPVVDGTFILERPTVTLSKGYLNGKVLLAVTNQNEGNIFVNESQTLAITDYVSRLFPDMTSAQVQEAANVYNDYGTPVEQAIMVMGDSLFVCPTYYSLKRFTGRSWKGLFAVQPAYHTNDIQYYFHSSARSFYNNTQFIVAFSQSFMSFAKDYDVNMKFDPANITLHWNTYDINETEMLFNRTENGIPVIRPIKTDPRILERCAFWATVTSATAQ